MAALKNADFVINPVQVKAGELEGHQGRETARDRRAKPVLPRG